VASTAVLYDLIARDNASRTFDRVGRSASGMGTTMSKVTKVAAGLGVALVGLGAGAAEAADKAAAFQSSMTKIQTQAGASAKDVATLTKQVLKLAPSTQQGPQALSEALYHLKSVGMDNVSAMKALKTASDLAAVGGADLEDTTNALAGAWRTGIKGATDFGQAASTVNAIIGAGNMTMTDFTDALSSGILPTAKTFGLTLKQVGAALALFTDEGVPANSAATRLRMSISLLGAPSAAAEKQLGKIGLSGLQLANAMRGPNGIIGAIQLLKDHLDASGLSAAQQSQILSRAFGGGKSSSAILSMVNNLDVLQQKQDQVNSSTSKYGNAVATQRKTAEAQWKILSSNMETLTIRLGTKLLPPITGFVQYLNQTAIPAAGKFTRKLTSLVPVNSIKTGFKTASGVVSDFFDGLSGKKTKKPATLPVQTPGVKAPVGVLAPASDSKKYGEQISKAINGGISGIDWRKLGKLLGKGLGSAVDWAASHAVDLSEKIAKAIGDIDWVDVGKSLGAIAIPVLIGFVDNLFAPLFTLDFWKKHWLDVIFALISVVPWGKLVDTVGGILAKIPWGKVGDFIAKVWNKVPWGKIFSLGDRVPWGKIFTFGPVGPAVGRWVGDIAGRVRSVFSGETISKITGWIGKQFGKIGDWIATQARLLPTRIGVAFLNMGKWLTDHVPGLGNGFIRAIAKVWGKFTLLQTGVNLIEGLYNGITSKIADGYNWVKTHVVDPVVGWVKSLFGVHSPSTVFAEIGGWLVSGLKAGISGGVKGLGVWIDTHVVTPVTHRFVGASTWLWSKGKAAVSGLKSGVTAGAKAIGSWTHSHVISPVVNTFKSAGSWLWSKGSAAVSGLKNGVLAGAKALGGWTTSHVVTPVTHRFVGASTWLYQHGKDLINGLKNGITGAIKGIGSWVRSHIVDPVVNAVKKFFGIHSPSTVFATLGGHLTSGLLKGMAQTGGTAIAKKVFGSLPSALASIVGKGIVHISSLPGKALKALGSLGSKLSGLLGGIFGGGGGSGVSRWSGDVAAVLAMLGAPSSALGAVLTRIGIESGGNPNAINLWDSNAKAGHPSQGLMQTIPSTFNAFAGPFRSRGITDPLASIYAGVNYAMHRYGKNWVSVMTRSGGYDSGGVASGKGYLPKYTPRPERVLSPRQTAAFERLVDVLDNLGSGGGSSTSQRPVTVHVHFDDPTLRDLIRVEVDDGLDDLSTALSAGRSV
jgi:TP901 family phage tail tape measure protein